MLPDIPDELIREFSKENGTIFVGAGLSMGAGLPSWADLVSRLRGDVRGLDPGEIYPPTQIAQFFENQSGRVVLIRRLRDLLKGEENKVHPTNAHEVLVDLPVQRIFTTNFDGLIETAIERICGHECHPVMDDKDLPYLDPKQKQVIKIHGGLEVPDSIILTTDDYNDFIAKKPAISGLLKTELQIRTVLFIGYSFSDYNLQMIASQAGREIGKSKRNYFILQFAPSEPVIKDFERHSFIVIPLEKSDTNKGRTEILHYWLDSFRRKIMSYSQGMVRRPKNNLPPRPPNFVGRDAELAELLQALRSEFPIVTIIGRLGIGKTSLAIQVAGKIDADKTAPASQLFDYVVWVSGRDKPRDQSWFSEVLNIIAMTTGFPVITQTPSTKIEQKKAEVNLLLRQFKILLIIDNFDKIDDQELTTWVQEIPGASKVLVTVTNQHTHLHPKGLTINLDKLPVGDGVEMLRRHAESIGIESLCNKGDLERLVNAADGNPQLMKIALGVVGDNKLDVEDVTNVLQGNSLTSVPDQKFKEILNISWDQLGSTAQNILLATPLFPRMRAIRRDALAALSTLAPESVQFAEALTECERNSLLEPESNSIDVPNDIGRRYLVHSTVRQFAEEKINQDKQLGTEFRRRFSEYFLNFVRARVIRSQPNVRYWNALVSRRMLEVDPEWPSIQEAMKYAEEAGQEESMSEFVLLLIHYMDCRFYTSERLAYVQKAIDILKSRNRKHDEALLRIDALGWTYMEENLLDKAEDSIKSGLEIVAQFSGPEWEDLRVLGLAWQARIWLERSPDSDKASELIRTALDIQCRPWIRSRVLMVAGDNALKHGNKADALRRYQESACEAGKYDGGGEYQIYSRIGLAYLDDGKMGMAKRTFSDLLETSTSHCIEIGKLYAQFGLAIIARKHDEPNSAVAYIANIRNELLKREKPNHLLLKMINEVYEERRTAERRQYPTH